MHQPPSMITHDRETPLYPSVQSYCIFGQHDGASAVKETDGTMQTRILACVPVPIPDLLFVHLRGWRHQVWKSKAVAAQCATLHMRLFIHSTSTGSRPIILIDQGYSPIPCSDTILAYTSNFSSHLFFNSCGIISLPLFLSSFPRSRSNP